ITLLILLPPPQPRPTLFPYTTLFRSTPHWPPKQASIGSQSQSVKQPAPESGPGRSKPPPSTGGGRSKPEKSRLGKSKPGKSKPRSEEHTSELQSLRHLVCRLLLEKKK